MPILTNPSFNKGARSQTDAAADAPLPAAVAAAAAVLDPAEVAADAAAVAWEPAEDAETATDTDTDAPPAPNHGYFRRIVLTVFCLLARMQFAMLFRFSDSGSALIRPYESQWSCIYCMFMHACTKYDSPRRV